MLPEPVRTRHANKSGARLLADPCSSSRASPGGDGRTEALVRHGVGTAIRAAKRRVSAERAVSSCGRSARRAGRESDDLTAMRVSESTACEGSQAVNGGGLKIRSRRGSWVRFPPLALITVRQDGASCPRKASARWRSLSERRISNGVTVRFGSTCSPEAQCVDES